MFQRHGLFLALILGLAITLSVLNTAQGFGEQELGVDGLRCDSCGTECSTVCGSRAFRTCCFNYIKKRSGSGGGEGQLGHQNHNDPGRSSNRMMAVPKLRRSGRWVGVGGDYEVGGGQFQQSDGGWAWFYPGPGEEGSGGANRGSGGRGMYLGANSPV